MNPRKNDPVIEEVTLICLRCIIGGVMVFLTLDFLFLLLWLFHHFVMFVGRY
ncbi:MAG TPA: hypothetical protein VIG47_02575 [Gemmatimonadaceae bacterium]|jgi:hypothetical protein